MDALLQWLVTMSSTRGRGALGRMRPSASDSDGSCMDYSQHNPPRMQLPFAHEAQTSCAKVRHPQ